MEKPGNNILKKKYGKAEKYAIRAHNMAVFQIFWISPAVNSTISPTNTAKMVYYCF